MSRMNPFKQDGLKVTNRFSVFQEKEQEKENPETLKKSDPYSRENNSFLKPQLRKNEYYYYVEESKPQEPTLSPSDFPELFVMKKENNIEKQHLEFANKLMQKNDDDKNKIVEVKDVEEYVKPLDNKSQTPMDTLNALCELYAYQERWGRYWYGSEAYDEMYGIDRSSSQYDLDNNELDYDDYSHEDDDDDDYY